jgi:hypothetical protein
MTNFKTILITTVLGAFVPLAVASDPPREKPAEPATTADTPETTPLAVSKAARSSGFFSANDRMYFLHNGRSYPVTTQYLLRVGRNGITGFDGRPMPLLNGHMLTAKGEIVPLPKDIKGLPAPSKAPPPPETPLPEPPAN